MGTSAKWKTTDNRCVRCLKNVESMTRVEQDQHEIDCKKQEKLI